MNRQNIVENMDDSRINEEINKTAKMLKALKEQRNKIGYNAIMSYMWILKQERTLRESAIK